MNSETNWLHLAYSFAVVAIIMYLLEIPAHLIKATLAAQLLFLTFIAVVKLMFMAGERR